MLRWAILGTGFISNTVVDAIGLSAGSCVNVVAGRNRDRLAAFQSAHGIAAATTDYHEAITSPEIDAVYIGLPNHVHHEVAIAAAAAGKAVLSEKSLTTTMQTAHELADAVRDRVFFVEGLMYLAHPLYRTLTDLLATSQIGTVTAINGRYSADIAGVVNPLGRGTIYNLGCYPASLLHLVIQTACGVDAFAQRASSGAGTLTADGTIGNAALTVRFDNGVLANLQSTDNFGMGHDFVIMTDVGELQFVTNPWLPTAGDNTITWTPYTGEPESIVVSDDNDAFYHQIKLVEACVAAGMTEAPRPSPRLADSLEIMALLTEWESHCLASCTDDAKM